MSPTDAPRPVPGPRLVGLLAQLLRSIPDDADAVMVNPPYGRGRSWSTMVEVKDLTRGGPES